MLNGAHAVTVPVDAVVVSPHLIPSSNNLSIHIAAAAFCPRFFSPLTLRNPFNCALDFELTPEAGIDAQPRQGTVGARETLTLMVAAEPSFGVPDTAVLQVRTGEQAQAIRVTTVYGRARGVTADQRVQVGAVSVGTATASATLRNSGLVDAFFSIAAVQSRMPVRLSFWANHLPCSRYSRVVCL